MTDFASQLWSAQKQTIDMTTMLINSLTSSTRINSVVIRLLGDLAPVIQVTFRERDHRPWFDAESRATRKSVRRLERLFKANKTVASRDA